ncbi:MAG: nitrous oxide reductase accessory protein NosL [Gammaproteobacteria bacterium]|nr:nitrous oxide reductase accessory protein NosL [Gammaproteobacteria bacterium]
MYKLSVLLVTFLLLACEKTPTIEVPPAQTLTRQASGYYCLMTVLNHEGPKGQIILTDKKVLWFTSVRDTISFTLSPEEPKNIAAIYVNDMTDANWANPGEDNWIDARKAWYVLNSNRSGGMGAAEAVPFATKEKAGIFAKEQGGNVTDFASIPKSYILDLAK